MVDMMLTMMHRYGMCAIMYEHMYTEKEWSEARIYNLLKRA